MDTLNIATQWKRGVPPSTAGGGGYIDQTESIIRGCEFVWSERERAKRSLNLREIDGQLVRMG